MRVMSLDDFGNYVAYEQVPGWMSVENYNFCEEFEKKNHKKGAFSILMTALLAIV